MNEIIQYLIGPIGISFLLSLSAYGSCDGMANCGASSTLYSDKPMIVTHSYVSMIMVSTVFFYAFIIGIIVMNKIDNNYTFIKSIWDLIACLLFGCIGLVGGKSMGLVSKLCFRRIVQKPEFFISFLFSLASLEVTLILAFLISLLIIYKH
ncbi:VATL [Hepatospora eriocheir]|uniref:VATL n=1 Tax=Hepatospora eriocheir TaxID=1081669 RepID=A0A1X0Q8S3_9MICR|nr:VATL [Hepatospora eriocheir]